MYTIVGNISNVPELGTKHFSHWTKVYFLLPVWGDGFERIRVVGKHRKSGWMISIIVSTDLIINLRVKFLYDPKVLKIFEGEKEYTKEELESFVAAIEEKRNGKDSSVLQ